MKTKLTKKTKKLNLTNEKYHLRKYNILAIIDSQPFKNARSLKKNIPKILQITRQTFYKWCNASVHSTLEIPSIKFLQLCEILDVKPHELINSKIDLSTPNNIHDIEVSEAITITGLTK